MLNGEFFEDMERGIAAEAERLTIAAKTIVGEYQKAYYRVIEERPQDEWGSYLPKVRVRTAGPMILWCTVQCRGPKGDRRFYTLELKRGQTALRYPPTTFAAAQPWELEQINQAEDKFQVLRRRSRLLGQVAQLVRSGRVTEVRYGILRAHTAAPPQAGTSKHGEGVPQRPRLVSDDLPPSAYYRHEDAEGER